MAWDLFCGRLLNLASLRQSAMLSNINLGVHRACLGMSASVGWNN